jgi:hypothetical protein
MCEVMIWVQDGLITIPTTLIIRSHNVGFTHLERHTYKRDIPTRETTLLNLNLRRIRYYTLIVSQCGQNVGFWRVNHKVTVEEDT